MEFAQPGDPFISSKGEVIPAEGSREPAYTLEIPEARKIRAKGSRSVREFGTDGQTQTVVNAVLVYHLIGVSDNEVAHLLGTTAEDVRSIKNLAAFQETFAILHDELINVNSSSIQARIAKMAGRALTNVMDLADSKPEKVMKKNAEGEEVEVDYYAVPPIVVYKANADILDRAGLSPDTLFGRKEDDAGQQLEIEITSADSNKTNVKVNVGSKPSR